MNATPSDIQVHESLDWAAAGAAHAARTAAAAATRVRRVMCTHEYTISMVELEAPAFRRCLL
jgi:hypothetical protein